MDTSVMEHTPLRNNDLRRRTLIQQSTIQSPLRRTSAIASPVLLEKTNDESERISRRSLVDMQRRMSNLPQSPLNDSAKFVGEQEMKDHFQICTKLFSANKITTKNAWQLHIIDLLRHMSQKPSSNTLQVASTSLDISAKVYGIRVDDIHADGLKLASSMARASDKQPPQNTDDNEDCEQTLADIENAAKKKKKKKRFCAGEKNTICKDPKSLITPLPKLESVFFSTRTNADTNPINNLFTNMLKMDHSGHKFMLLNNEKSWPEGPDPILHNKGCEKKFSLTSLPLTKFNICVPFSGFKIDEWDPEEEEKKLQAEKLLISQRENELIYDENGIPIPELDGTIHDIFSNDGQADNDMAIDDEEEEQEFCVQVQGEITHIVDFKPSDVSQRTEYSYNSILSTHSGKYIDQIWAGPSHWKLKYIRRSSAKFSGQLSAQPAEKNIVNKQAKKKQKPQIVEFTEELSMDTTRELKIKKKPPTTDPHKITLPVHDPSGIILIENLSELILKLKTAPVRKAVLEEETSKNGVNYEVSAYKYENPNDSEYCSQQNDDNDPIDNDELMDDNFDSDDIIAAQQNFLGENLVDVPELVPNSYVPYALQAKKTDMKKLKTAVWQHLTNNKDVIIDKIQPTDVVIPTTFSNLFDKVPLLLNEKMRKELSCPLVFVALLHLCNEQNLALIQHTGFKDFDIRGPK